MTDAVHLQPRGLRTRIQSRIGGWLASEAAASRRERRARRQRGSAAPTIHYFHQVDDPYSFLAAQRLNDLAEAYAVEVAPHLAPPPAPAYLGDAKRHPGWALADARDVAPFYGVEPPGPAPTDPDAAATAQARLAGLPLHEFSAAALEHGRRVWNGSPANGVPVETPDDVLAASAALRRKLGHYGGAMFWYDGAWYWGLARLAVLEHRLRAEGLARDADTPLVAPEPTPETVTGAAGVTLEVFPSLRSPYTAVSFPAIRALVRRTGVDVVWRPVMPMMMRGVAAPRPKQLWIISDAARAGRRRGVTIGRWVDPFGEPVARALSLWQPIHAAGRGEAFLAAYLEAAWVEGHDVTRDAGLLEVVRRGGLDPSEFAPLVGGGASAGVLESNLDAMLGAGLWGVPSFRVSGGDAPPLACWGQDRLWRIETEIARRARALQT